MSNLSRKLMMGAAGAAGEKVYVEDVFSTYLYTGNDSTQTITNGIDLSGKGGMVWMKSRSVTGNHGIVDTVRGRSKYLFPTFTSEELTSNSTSDLTSFNSNGFSLGPPANANWNSAGVSAASWTFRKAEKFFDVVTYTGDGTAGKTVAHSLGSVPGMIIVKSRSVGDNWAVYHRSIGATQYIKLNGSDAATSSTLWNNTAPTSSVFTVGAGNATNTSGVTHVAYLFAHDAGGFGDSGDESVIKCGSYTGNGAADGQAIDLGWEPQWLMIKGSSVASNWQIIDTMRGATVATGGTRPLRADLSNAEYQGDLGYPYATGFVVGPSTNTNNSGSTYIYIAIRRGPMKTPTDATEVFDDVTYSGTASPQNISISPNYTDLVFIKRRTSTDPPVWTDRLRGDKYLRSSGLDAEATWDANDVINFDRQASFGLVSNTTGYVNSSGQPYISYSFRRAPGFFDVVAYTGTGASTLTLAHNLGVEPEFIIQKCRSNSFEWWCWHKDLSGATGYIWLQSNAAKGSSTSVWGNTLPTTTQFTVGSGLNTSARTFIAYLFATCPGVSKVGSYAGTGTTLNIDCGFAAGARFVMIKRTDSTGDWYVYDSARGIVSGNDPYLLINSTAAEVTSTDYIDPLSSGFQISSTAPAAINASGGSFIFLAIA